jgi:hypothetical protein
LGVHQVGLPAYAAPPPGAATAAEVAQRLMQQAGVSAPAVAAAAPEPAAPTYEAELEINDFPQHARWKVGPGAPASYRLLGSSC